jgi:hypothetical protein
MSNSIGDLKNSGLQGNNFPWQYKVLKGLQSIIDGQCDCKVLDLIELNTRLTEQNTRPVQRRGFIDRYPFGSTGSLGTSVYSISIANTGTADATVNGSTIRPGEVLNFDAGGMNNFFPPNYWNFDCTANPGAELLVTYIRT